MFILILVMVMGWTDKSLGNCASLLSQGESRELLELLQVKPNWVWTMPENHQQRPKTI